MVSSLVVRSASSIHVWDVSRGIRLADQPELGDIRALISPRGRFPFHLDQSDFETIIRYAETEKTIAWYPEIPWMSKMRVHPSGRIWASAKATNHVYLFTLEGGSS